VVIWWFQQSSNDTTTASNVSNYSETVTKDVIAKEILPLEEMPVDSVATKSNVQVPPSDNQSFSVESADNVIIAVSADSTESAEIVDDSNNQSELTDVVETTDTETAAPVELIFEFAGDCWMNLADATGENIAYGVKVKGRVMPVTGIPPFVVTLGAPEVVKIRYAGEPLDMSFLPAGRIAKFDLPLSE
jgi:cytoskeleton protein RodZ